MQGQPRPLSEGSSGVRAQSSRFRLDIQGLRAVAVLCVVLYHCGLAFIGGGYIGVDVFFVISGFLITSHLFNELSTTGRISLLGFYARRARRLLVPAVLVIIVTVAVAWLYGPKLSVGDTAKDGAYSSVYLINYHLAALAVDYQHAGAAASPLQHYWSLAAEEQFYLVWPVLLLVTAWLFRRWSRRPVVAVLVAVAVTVSLALSIEMTPNSASLAYFSLQTRAWQLGVGAAIAIGLPLLRTVSPLPAATASWLGLGLVVGSAVGFDDNTPWPGYLAVVPVVGAGLVIAGGVVGPARGAELLLRRQPLQFLGKVSYAWYLWHWPAVTLAPSLVGHSIGPFGKIVACAVALLLAWLTLLLVEQPVLRTRSKPRIWLPLGAAASACAIAVSLLAYHVSPLRLDGPAVAPVSLGAHPEAQLRTLITQADTVDNVPRNLTPGLLAAGTDGRNQCVTQLTETIVRRCTFGNPSAPHTVVLFGDSHADQWTPVLKNLAVAAGWRLITLTRVGCPLANYVVYVDQLRRRYTECATWRDGRVAEIATLHPDLVVLGQSDTIGSDAYTAAQWARTTAETVAKVTAASTRVVYLGDTPHPPANIPVCLAAHLSSASRCDFANPTLSGTRAANAVQADRARDIAAAVRKLGAAYLETSSWFCQGRVCPTIVGNVLIYRDDSHVSSRAAQLVAPLLRPVLFPQAVR